MASANRLKQYLVAKGMNNREADDLFGFSNGLTGKFLAGKTVLGVDKIENILSACPDLNGDWLITGRGAMLVNDHSHHSQVTEPKTEYGRNKDLVARIAELEARLADKDEIIEALRETIKLYKTVTKNRTNSI
ncbi:hypothetical protein [Spirosoma aerolatum]|uniref:hypothetical protein n=1 Tax=Spirosoma aerolatum TaxID=1211326 RepID=UPI0009AEB7D0|nr:hypothetical protein [Spirosoma aerolatum]